MIFRSLSLAAVAICCCLDGAHAAAEAPASAAPQVGVTAADAGRSAYRAYVKAQADTLVGMTRVLARAIAHGDLDTAQLTYAPAHRYFERIRPTARSLGDLDKRLNARADAYPSKETDGNFSGFHRLEYGLFATKSTEGLSDYADRLDKDARALRDRLAVLDPSSAVLADATAASLSDIADASLTGDEERYSKTDLWDIEANIDGAREVVAMLQPQLRTQTASVHASTAAQIAEISVLIETHKVGCGFKSYDELGRADRLALKARIAALASELSTLRDKLAMD